MFDANNTLNGNKHILFWNADYFHIQDLFQHENIFAQGINMQVNYVYMQDNYLNLPDNYVYMDT